MLHKYCLLNSLVYSVAYVLYVLNIATIISLFFFPESEYRHGFDYHIMCLHLPSSIFSYLFFFIYIFISFSHLFLIYYKSSFFYTFSLLGLVSVSNCLVTGFF